MTQRKAILPRCLVATAALVASLSISGCGGIEFQGKLFEAAGLSTGSTRREEPILESRGPLVPPPRTGALPEPGSAPPPQGHMAWPDDPDRKKVAARQYEQQKQKELCDRQNSAVRPVGSADENIDPACRKSILSGVGGQGSGILSWFGGGSKSKDGAAETTRTEDEPLLRDNATPRR
jgi:hypothetical protein